MFGEGVVPRAAPSPCRARRPQRLPAMWGDDLRNVATRRSNFGRLGARMRPKLLGESLGSYEDGT